MTTGASSRLSFRVCHYTGAVQELDTARTESEGFCVIEDESVHKPLVIDPALF
jgi:hypothetical protein